MPHELLEIPNKLPDFCMVCNHWTVDLALHKRMEHPITCENCFENFADEKEREKHYTKKGYQTCKIFGLDNGLYKRPEKKTPKKALLPEETPIPTSQVTKKQIPAKKKSVKEE